jgi:transcriptional regulator with XRE-family HTH domain
MDYGKALRIARAVSGVSQTALAKKSGLDASYISLIEKGSRTPSLPTLERLSRALGVPGHLVMLLAAESQDYKIASAEQITEAARLLVEFIVSNGLPSKRRVSKKNRKD